MLGRWSWCQRLSGLTTVLGLAGVGATWFSSTGTTCVMYVAPRPERCVGVSMWASIPNHLLAAILLLASVGFALLPLYGGRARWVLWAFAGVVIGFYVLSFGLDPLLLPAALVAVAASVIQV